MKTPGCSLPVWWVRCGLLAASLPPCIFLFRARTPSLLTKSTSPKLEYFVSLGYWYTTLALILGLLFAATTAHLWLTRPSISHPPRPQPPPLTRTQWVLLLAILLLALVLRWPRMNLSLYADEAYAVQRQIHGIHHYERQKNKDGERLLMPFKSLQELKPKFRPVSWRETLWRNPIGNNHLLFNVLSRGKLEIWKSMGTDRAEHFSLPVLRLPSLLAALGTLAMLFCLGRTHGGAIGASAGLLAAALIAIHPWHIRYSTEARGYSLAMFLAVLTLWFLLPAIQTDRWRAWFGFAFAQAGMLLAYPGTLYIAVPLNLTALLIFIFRRCWHGPIARLTVFNVLSGLLFLSLYSPQIPQLLSYLEEQRTQAPLGTRWILNFASLLGTGSLWASPDPTHPLIIDLVTPTPDRWLGITIAFVALPILTLLGLQSISRDSRTTCLLIASVIVSIFLGYMHAATTGRFLYLWYLIVPLPFVFLASAWGLSALSFRFTSSRLKPALVALLTIALFAVATHRSRAVVLAHSKAPLLPALRLVYGDTRPQDLKKRVALTTGFWTESPVHDPWFIHTAELKDYNRLMEAARREKMPMYVFFQRTLAVAHSPHLVQFIENSGHFEQVGLFHGLEEPQFTERVFRLKSL